MTDEENNILDMDEDADYEASDGDAEEHAAEPLTARERLREQLASEVAAFLAKGGKIHHIESNIMADGPRKPPCSYGGQPL